MPLESLVQLQSVPHKENVTDQRRGCNAPSDQAAAYTPSQVELTVMQHETDSSM
jgi:hypothetical protein